MDLNLDFVRAEANAGFDQWFYWLMRLRDLLNSAERYDCEAFHASASPIREQMRHASLDTQSKIYRFECIRQRLEKGKAQ